MSNFEENPNKKRQIDRNVLNQDEIKVELYFLIVNFLRASGNNESADALERELERIPISSLRLKLNGEIVKISLREMMKEFSRTPQTALFDSLIQTIKVLREVPNGHFQGLSSLLSARFPSKQNAIKKQLSTFPMRPYTNTFCSIIKRQYCFPKRLNIDNLKENIMKNAKLKKLCLGHLSSTYCVIFDRTGKAIITGSDDTLVKIWRTTKYQLIGTLRGHTGAIADLAISYDNKVLATAGVDGLVFVWDTETLANLAVLRGHVHPVSSIKFCPRKIDGKNFLISTGNDASLCIWTYREEIFDKTPTRFIEKIRNSSMLISSSFSPGGKYLVVGSSDSKLYIYSFGDQIKKVAEYDRHDDQIDTVEFAHNGEKFLTASKDGQAVIWYPRLSSWSTICLNIPQPPILDENNPPKNKIVNITWSLDDEKLIGSTSDHIITIWSAKTGNVIQTAKYHQNSVFSIECHPYLQNYYLTAGHDGNVVLWDMSSATPVYTYLNIVKEEGFSAIYDAKFSPCGFYFAATDITGHIMFFDVFQDNQSKPFPKEQFLYADYKPTVIIDDVLYDEESGLLPHQLPPQYAIDEAGRPHAPIYQMFNFGRITDLSDRNLQKLGFLEKDTSGNSNKDLSINEVDNYEILCEYMNPNIHESINATMPITQRDIDYWSARELIPQFLPHQLKYLEDQIKKSYDQEVVFYASIYENGDPLKIHREERKNKLLSLKSKVLLNRSAREAEFELGELTAINDEPSNHLSGEDPDFIESEESNSSITTESSISSLIRYSQSSRGNITRELCTRRKTYHLQQRNSQNTRTTTEPEKSSGNTTTANEDFVYPHLSQNSGITADWLNVEKPNYSPYFPQVGDIVVYHLVGHKIYCRHVINNRLFYINLNRVCFNRTNLKITEVCKVNNITFPPGYPYMCSVSLTKMDTSGTYSTGLNFNVQFTDVTNLDDFITLKKFYDDSEHRVWEIGDSFKSFIDEKWWGGEIINIMPIDKRYPESDFRSICVRWNSGETDTLSPWDIFPPDFDGDLLYQPEEIDWSPETMEEARQRIMAGFDTIQILPQFSEIETFLSEKSSTAAFFTSFCKISRKISNRFYRRKKAIIWELRMISTNLTNLKPPNTLLQAAKILTQALILFIKDVAYDVMAIIDKISHGTVLDRESSLSSIEDVKRSKRTTNIPTELKWLLEADELLTYLTGLSVSKPFLEPVDLDEYPDYLSFVKTPMDFTKIKNKLNSGGYISPDQFVDDIKLILSNSRAYNTNRKSNIYSITLRLSNIFNKKLQELLPKWNNENINRSTLLTRSKISSFLKRLGSNANENVQKKSSKVLDFTPIAARVRKRRQSSQTCIINENFRLSENQKKPKKVVVSDSSCSSPIIKTRSYELKKQNETSFEEYLSYSEDTGGKNSLISHGRKRSLQSSKSSKQTRRNGRLRGIQKTKKRNDHSENFEESTTIESEELEELLGSGNESNSKAYNLRSKKESDKSSSLMTPKKLRTRRPVIY